MNEWSEFQGINTGYVVELYEKFHRNPASVDAVTRAAFERWGPPEGITRPAATFSGTGSSKNGEAYAASGSALPVEKIVGAVNLAESIRKFGNLDAYLDPLGSAPHGDPSLIPENHGVTEDDLRHLPAGIITGPIANGARNALEVIQSLRRVYCAATGYDYAHLRDPEEREWLKSAAESGTFRPPTAPIDEIALLDRITQEGCFEQFLDRTFPGKTRFSIQGIGILIPMLDEIIHAASDGRFSNILIGMAHRARLNVLAHVLDKPYEQILAEFKDPVKGGKFREDLGWTGDVKYHSGAHHAIRNHGSHELMISLAPNPSHLEAVNPVVEGMARAAGTRTDHGGAPHFEPTRTLPILIHGDAAFMGQGVVAETLNMFHLKGYETGGTVHIIANNEIGFTTCPEEGRSTLYASDLARGFRVPIVHVNADNPEACIEAARLAFTYREHFKKDFVIDLIGYRRHGHNEGDEPSFTQPLMYKKIQEHPTVRQIWAKVLLDRGVIQDGIAEQLVDKHSGRLRQIYDSLEAERQLVEPRPAPPPPGAARDTRTEVPLERLLQLNSELLRIPPGFVLHRKIERVREKRLRVFEEPDARTIDWAAAEELAWATILEEGIPIRVTGQDVERGTFSQRHAVFHDVNNGNTHTPLQSLPQARASFEICNSPLSENAALGFEYGYNVQSPQRLVVWEAQYGDFINGAQTVIDEFISSARAKWGLTPSLVMLLPHGYEGQGPDHSGARLERFLQLAAATNLRIANCTTAAQYFHLMRLQALLLKTDPLPLVILTPKSLLRHPLTASTPRELAEGSFQRVIEDEAGGARAGEIRRLILCSGKIYIDLVSSKRRAEEPAVAIARIEEPYPFPESDLKLLLDSYPSLAEVVWVQEEPRNMGAWEFLRLQLARLIAGRWPLHYLGRPRNSSPAEGSSSRHAINQEIIISQAFNLTHIEAEESLLLQTMETH
ncbi:MAG TPA: 2-oxoglutarate dehydrogenase E1 component [Terriglobia bacterium]|nr:2-oxoglutarate dehydrogenase E1 component [Terriglobia bacterium]